MTNKNKIRYFTKEDIKLVFDMWEGYSLQEIADKLGRPKYSISYLANAMRKQGIKLPRKHSVGQLQNLIKQVAGEINLPK